MPDWDYQQGIQMLLLGSSVSLFSHYFEHIELDCKGRKMNLKNWRLPFWTIRAVTRRINSAPDTMYRSNCTAPLRPFTPVSAAENGTLRQSIKECEAN